MPTFTLYMPDSQTASATAIIASPGFLQSGTGATSRTMLAKAREVISVKDFGAVGDGTTNDAAAIQAAIDASSSNTTIVFPAGTYGIGSAGLSISGKTGIVLEGRGGTVKLLAASGTSIASLGATSIRIVNSTRCGVRNLVVDGNGQASNQIGVQAGTECFVEDCTVFAGGATGQIVASGGGIRNAFRNNISYSGAGTARGFWIGNNTVGNMEADVLIESNTARDNNASGIIAASIGGRVVGNHSYSNEGAGIVLPGADGLAASNMIVGLNECYDNLFHGIQSDVMYSTAADCINGITITGNTCNNNARGSGSGIYMLHTINCVVSGNTCMDNIAAGIVGDDDNTGLTISGNICSDTRAGGSRTQQIGIRLNVTTHVSSGHTVCGNTCRNNTNTGIQSISTVSGKTITGLAITGNTVTDNASYGVFISETGTGDISNAIVTGNNITGHGTFDVRCFIPKLNFGSNSYGTASGIATATLTDNDTSPSVASRSNWLASNTAATSITTFDDGRDGQTLVIRATNGNTTLVHGATLVLQGAVNVTLASTNIVTLVKQGTVWYETGRNF